MSGLKISCILLAAFVPEVCLMAQEHCSIQELKLSGMVKMLVETTYATSDSTIEPSAKVFSKTVYHYNQKGFLTGTEAYNGNGKLSYYSIDRIDTLTGRRLEERSYFPDSQYKCKTTYQYDAKGNLQTERVYEGKDSSKPAVVNRLLHSLQDDLMDDSDDVKVDIEMFVRHKDKDIMGNWQLEVTFEHKLPISILKREITYYTKDDE